jgi:polar amino acid transport system substrate-binding protein
MSRRSVFAAALACVALAIFGSSALAGGGLQRPGELTVGVSLPSEGFQVGVVKGSTVLMARGLEIDLARELSKRLGLSRTRFVQSDFDRLLSGGVKPWDLSIAEITITPARRRLVDFSIPYMRVDQGVLLAQTVDPIPRTIAALRPLQLCALAGSTGADLVRTTIRPTVPMRSERTVPRLMLDLQTGACQAVVYDAPALGTLKERAPLRFGPFAGVIRTGEEYGIALPIGSPLVSRVDNALASMLSDGTIAELQRKWLSGALNRLPVLG